jgi:hypothetical protein
MTIDWRRPITGVLALAAVAVLVLATMTGRAQTSSATLTGTVFDTSNAVVPGATVALTNDASGAVRREVSNGDGYFTFAAIQPGSYTIRIEAKGFAKWEGHGIALSSGDNRTVSGIRLKPGTSETTVVVQASTGQITPTDSGEKSFTIGQNVMQNVAIIGQNAAEFIKIMPGMAMTGGVLNQSSYAASDEATGNGPVGSFAANGQRTGALDITSDGAHILDPGCNCGQTENTNVEMTSEVTVMTSNFGADQAKGPVVINAVGKSGGQQFHGEAYLYSRYYTFNANDWLGNHSGVNGAGQQLAPRPDTKYFYPGGNIGGPLIIPGTNFNKHHDKMFFFVGSEYYHQIVDNGIYRAAVPTANMRKGDFTQPDSNYFYTKNLSGSAINNSPTGGGHNKNAYSCTTMQVVAGQNSGNPICVASMVDPTQIDKSNGQAMVGIYPLPNADPTLNQGYNYVTSSTRYSNMWQIRGRVDYNISDSTKLFVEYNHQNDSREESLDTLWTGNAQSWDDPTTPYPSPLLETSDSELVTANMTKVFSPTLTNELIFNWNYINLPNHFQDPNKVSRAGLGINYQMLFQHANEGKLIYPEMTGWGNGISNQLNSGFELDNGIVFAKKTLPSVADNISKVWKTHTAKFGFYWERTWNSQPGQNAVNGSATYSNWGANTSGNAYADMLIGQTTNYSEGNFNVTPAFRYISTEFYATDSWKVGRRVTLDYGLRLSHLGPWVDSTGYGFAAWYPTQFAAGTGATASGVKFPGLEWHAAQASTPLSGSSSRLLFYDPRVGFAWDIFGNGRTVFRGGYGIYYFHDEQNVQNGAYGVVRGAFSSPSIGATDCGGTANCKGNWSGQYGELSPSFLTGSLAAPSSVTALDPTDSNQPRTQDWSVTVAERAPWHSLVEVSYVGNKSDYLSNYNNNFYQINDIPVGLLFQKYGWLPDCYPAGQPNDGGACGKSGADTGFNSTATGNARPLGSAYGTLKIINHKMYSNYNGLQVSWNKQQGHFYWLANYTFSKALGIRGENGAASGDPTNLKNNYGTLPNNRYQIINLAYVYQFPTLTNGNGFVKAFANGWELSGITQYQSGADLQAAVTANFNYTAYVPAGTTFMGETVTTPFQASNQNILGTPDVTLMPKVICDPRKNRADKQYINGNCFANFATPGQQGTYIFPTTTGPGFFNSDLSAFKNFVFGSSEERKLQFRFSGYNFLNHPVRTFVSGDPSLNVNFNSAGVLTPNAPNSPFGFAENKTGHRIIQGEAKFTW